MEQILPLALPTLYVGIGLFVIGLILSLTSWGRSVPSAAGQLATAAEEPWWKRLVIALARVFQDLVKIFTGRVRDVPRYAMFTSAGLVLVIVSLIFFIMGLFVDGAGSADDTPSPSPTPSTS